MQADERFQASLWRLKQALAAERVVLAANRVRLLLKAGFRPDQPRVPAGRDGAGRWTDETGRDSEVRPLLVSGRRTRNGGQVSINGRWIQITPAQQVRAQLSHNAMRKAVRDVQRIDPNWRPRPQAYETVEGLIAANRATQAEARLRLMELNATRSGRGEFGGPGIDAPPTDRRLTKHEQEMINKIGRKWGCHWWGSANPKTKSGNLIGDHQPARILGQPSRLCPHCAACSSSQGGLITGHRRRRQ